MQVIVIVTSDLIALLRQIDCNAEVFGDNFLARWQGI